MTDEMKKWMQAIVCCLIIAIAVAACSETITNPNTPGSGLLTRDIIIRDTVLTAVSDTTVLRRIAPDNVYLSPIGRNFVGRDGNLVANSLLRFYPPARDTIRVLSATLKLTFLSWRGASTGSLGFTIHTISKNWGQLTATWDTVQLAGFFDQDTIRGAYTGTRQGDTLTISIDLDTTMVRNWYRTGATNYGVLLVPTASSTLIRGFQAFIDGDTSKLQPELRVLTQGTSSTTTVLDSFQVGADTYVADAPLANNTLRLFTQAGVAHRSVLSFDVSRLPAGTIINSAELLLERDPALSNISSFTTTPQPSVHVLVSNDTSNYESEYSAGAIKSGTTNTYSFDVRHHVQYWINGTNYGLLLRQPNTNEFGTLDLFAFYSNNASPDSLRPRIRVKYSVFQN